jgi:hypothetical protein
MAMPQPTVLLPATRLSRLLIAASVLALALILPSCATVATEPPAVATLAGSWQLDAAASDDFDRKLEHALDTERNRMRARHGSAGTGRGSAADPDALVMPPEEPAKERARLAEDLRPPATLRISVNSDSVEITRDAEPVRRFQPGQEVSRLDSSGTAIVSSDWKQSAFVIHARYTNKSSREWRFEVDAAGLLHLNFTAKHAEFGSFALQTAYRRATNPD